MIYSIAARFRAFQHIGRQIINQLFNIRCSTYRQFIIGYTLKYNIYYNQKKKSHSEYIDLFSVIKCFWGAKQIQIGFKPIHISL
jgi:hypothetical protein